MKILHTADLHLGKILYSRSLMEDQKYFVREIFLPVCIREQPDCVVITGDIFDRAVAPIPALALFDEMITSIAGEGIPLVIISGNHDGAERMALGARLLKSSGVHICTSLQNSKNPIIIGNLAIHPLPYFDPAAGKAFLGRDEPMSYDDIFAAVVDLIDTSDNNLIHILAAHCTVLGSLSCDSESKNMVGGSDQISTNHFDKFDYTLLGHLHQNQTRGDKMTYSGSPLKYSFDSNERDKAFNLLDIDKGTASLQFIPIKPLRDMHVIRGRMEGLLEGEGSDDYYFAELADTELVYEPMMRLRTVYPNILGMAYVNQSLVCQGSGRDELRDKLRVRALGDAEVFSAFLRQMCAAEPTDSQVELFLSLCGEEEIK